MSAYFTGILILIHYTKFTSPGRALKISLCSVAATTLNGEGTSSEINNQAVEELNGDMLYSHEAPADSNRPPEIAPSITKEVVAVLYAAAMFTPGFTMRWLRLLKVFLPIMDFTTDWFTSGSF